MLKGVDHLVIVVPELEAAVADGAYLELIAFFEPHAP